MKNLGKVFEENWKKSIPYDVFYYRFRDSAGTWGGNENIRFTPSNIADNILYGKDNFLHLIELKSHKGKSIPLSCIIGKKNKTKIKQMEDLRNANRFTGIFCSIIVFFSDVERCFELGIEDFYAFLEEFSDKKSIPISYFEDRGFEIEVFKLRTNYRYDIKKWLEEF